MCTTHSTFITRYETAGVEKRAHSASLYYSRQCGVVIKPRFDVPDNTVVCFMTHDCSSKLKKKALLQAKYGLSLAIAHLFGAPTKKLALWLFAFEIY